MKLTRRTLLGAGAFVAAARADAAPDAAPDAFVAGMERAGGARSAIGVDRWGTAIPSLVDADSLDHASAKTSLLLVGGLDGSRASAEAVAAAWRWFHSPEAAAVRRRYTLAAVPVANPFGWSQRAGAANGAGGDPTRGYPTAGEHYNSPTDPEAQHLWRWIGMHAPDVAVVVLGGGGEAQWRAAEAAPAALRGLASGTPTAGSLAAELVRHKPSDTGAVPAIEAHGFADGATMLRTLVEALDREPAGVSAARREIRSRLARTPLEVARQLAAVYGHELPSVVYIPAVALIGRLRLGELTGDAAHRREVETIAAPYLSGGKPTLGDRPTSSHLPGHLVFGELARVTGDGRYIDLARRAADLGFDAAGRLRESMPLHSEMSDSVFMGCAISAQAGALTGERRYFEMALRHLRFMEALDLRPDGLYRHSPLAEAAWGRGNGFPALGLAWSLSETPAEAPEHAPLLAAYRNLMDALLPHQDPTGMWRQVIDKPGGYREYTATAMIGYALTRGLRRGWIAGERYEQAAQRAWRGILTRTAADGGLVDVCQSTGKQPDLRSYYNRAAILGRDDRGGAMGLLFAVEAAAK